VPNRQSSRRRYPSPQRIDEVSATTEGRLDSQEAGGWLDDDVHEAIERHRDPIGFYAEWRECNLEIAEASLMWVHVAIDDLKCLFGAGRQEKIVPADLVSSTIRSMTWMRFE
jgi:hypothetical protein